MLGVLGWEIDKSGAAVVHGSHSADPRRARQMMFRVRGAWGLVCSSSWVAYASMVVGLLCLSVFVSVPCSLPQRAYTIPSIVLKCLLQLVLSHLAACVCSCSRPCYPHAHAAFFLAPYLQPLCAAGPSGMPGMSLRCGMAMRTPSRRCCASRGAV
jgi:hypothetical protein